MCRINFQPQVAKDEESIKRWLTGDGPGGYKNIGP